MEIVVAAATAIAGSIASAAGLGFWLSGKFQDIKDDSRLRMEIHEAKDDRRHEDNIAKFNEIEVTLARFGERGRASPR